MIGTKLSHFRIVAKLGEGGMGVVYRAEDERLRRQVALKVLPPELVANEERRLQFLREARTAAALSHPNIAAIHEIDEADGIVFIAMELVEGETLREFIRGRPMPIKDALCLAIEMAAGLAHAHQGRVIHRDLKPDNVMVTPDQHVKILDFGLAKLLEEHSEATRAELSKLETVSVEITRAGKILGTVAYMSPEQARVKPVDRRTDVWSFGCVLFEMLAGKQAFGSETVSDTIVKILEREPDWEALPDATPPNVRRLLERCLRKDPDKRVHDVADARIELDDALAGPADRLGKTWETSTAARTQSWQDVAPWKLGAAIVIVIALISILATFASIKVWRKTRGAPPLPLARFTISYPPGLSAWGGYTRIVALSPDGSRVVYAASTGQLQLYLRRIDKLEAEPIKGTEGAQAPFFSPDGQWIGFLADGKLKRVPITGGLAQTLCEASRSWGASWGPDGQIVLQGGDESGLSRVSAVGGQPEPLTHPDASKGERSHLWPEVLPSAKAVVFTIERGEGFEEADIAVRSLETGEQRILVEGGTSAQYTPTGHLVFARKGSLWAVRFDLTLLDVTGPIYPVLEGVRSSPVSGAAHFALSKVGSLVYAPGTEEGHDHILIWVDRKGVETPLSEFRRLYSEPRLSPDGQQVAVRIRGARHDLWIFGLTSGTLSRLTHEHENFIPVWTPNGERITFASNRDGQMNLFWMSAGGGEAVPLIPAAQPRLPGSWSPDGQLLAFTEVHPDTKADIWLLPLGRERKPVPFLRTRFNEAVPRFSPDGRWIAYESDETGRTEIYVTPLADSTKKWQISNEGGRQPVWARTGRELFYISGERVIAVTIASERDFRASAPGLLFKGLYNMDGGYDVASDSQRFLVTKDVPTPPINQLIVVLNWSEELDRLAPAETK